MTGDSPVDQATWDEAMYESELRLDALILLVNTLLSTPNGIDHNSWDALASLVRLTGDKHYIDWFFNTGRIGSVSDGEICHSYLKGDPYVRP